jgi:hypothetical protein
MYRYDYPPRTVYEELIPGTLVRVFYQKGSEGIQVVAMESIG